MVHALRRIVVSLLAVALVVAITALVFELIATLIFGEQGKFPRKVIGAPWGLRTNDPHSHYRHKSADFTAWFTINGQGMRAERDYAYTKPPGVKRILMLGDSFTIGYEVRAESTFASVLERSLRARGYTVEVLNAGVSGFGTAEEYLYLVREGLKYHPDVVVVTFWINDLIDNPRSNLFALRNGRLVQTGETYIPGGRFADFLNTFPPLLWLSEYSNAFALIKERVTELAKGQVVRENLQNVTNAKSDAARVDSMQARDRRLTAALYEKIYETTRANEISLVIQSIPVEIFHPDHLVDLFPVQEFDVHRPNIYFLPAKSFLDPYEGKRLLYWKRSAGHWTPFSHRLSGEALANLIAAQHLLEDTP
jgi:lysophospholipase L1-like esterase